MAFGVLASSPSSPRKCSASSEKTEPGVGFNTEIPEGFATCLTGVFRTRKQREKDTGRAGSTPAKRHRGEPVKRHPHGTHGDTRAQGSHTCRRTSQPTQPPNPQVEVPTPTHPHRTTARRPDPRPTQQPGSPGADHSPRPTLKRPPRPRTAREPATLPPPAARAQSASPRLLKGGQRNEGCRRDRTGNGLVSVSCVSRLPPVSLNR